MPIEGFNHPTFGAVQLKSMEFFSNKTGDDNHLCRGKKNMVDIPILWGFGDGHQSVFIGTSMDSHYTDSQYGIDDHAPYTVF